MEDFRKYYVSYALFSFSNGLFSIFANVLFFSNGNLSEVIYYQIAYQLSQLVFFIVSTLLMKYISSRILFSTGNILRGMVVLGLLSFSFLSSNGALFGLIMGIPSGIFWGGNATFSLQISRQTNRFSFLSRNSSISGLFSLIAPTIAGFLIAYSEATGILKYLNDFVVVSICLIHSGIMGLTIKVSGEKGGLMKISSTILSESGYNKFRLYFFCSSVLGIILSNVVSVYIFYLTGNYIITGTFGTVTAAIAFLSNIMAPRLTQYFKWYAHVAIFVIIVGSFLFYIRTFNQVFFIFLGSALIFYFISPVTNLGMTEFMGYLDKYKTTRHFWINREYYLNFGRIVSLGSVLWIYTFYGLASTIYLMPVFSLTMLGYIPILLKGKKS